MVCAVQFDLGPSPSSEVDGSKFLSKFLLFLPTIAPAASMGSKLWLVFDSPPLQSMLLPPSVAEPILFGAEKEFSWNNNETQFHDQIERSTIFDD